MKTKQLFIIFVIVALVQAAIPLRMILESESTLKHGNEYKFETVPIDPVDPLKGKYIMLSYTADRITLQDTTWQSGDEVRVYLEKDERGFAKIAQVSRDEPDTDKDYFFAEVQRYDAYNKQLIIDIPFDRFYMEESKAQEAENAYIEYSNEKRKEKPAYALVAVKDGNAALKDVIIDGMPIREYVLREREKRKDN